MSKCVAFTKLTPIYPGYINFTKTDNDVTVYLRSDSVDNQCGVTVSLQLTHDEFKDILDQLNKMETAKKTGKDQ